MSIESLLWLFPIIFMFHDFEEIIFMKLWVTKNESYIKERFPLLAKLLLPRFSQLSTASFSFGVAIEFILISGVTFFSIIYQSYTLWFALFIGFFVHLLAHVIQWIIFRKYVPVIVTSITAGIGCFFILKGFLSWIPIPITAIIISTIAGSIVVGLFIPVLHVLIKRFDNWMQRMI